MIAHEKITENIELIKDYAEDSLPVLNDQKCIIGILTAQDVIEAVDDEMGEDYAKLAGFTSEEDLKETTIGSTATTTSNAPTTLDTTIPRNNRTISQGSLFFILSIVVSFISVFQKT